MTDIITSIKADLDHDKVMIEQIQEEIEELELKLKYYQGKFDGRNEAFNVINKKEELK